VAKIVILLLIYHFLEPIDSKESLSLMAFGDMIGKRPPYFAYFGAATAQIQQRKQTNKKNKLRDP
jgi:hypothetical protein